MATKRKLSENAQAWIGRTVLLRWGTSRGRDTYGYTTCRLVDDRGKKWGGCSGGGYDLRGTALGIWIEQAFADELRTLKRSQFPKRQWGRPDCAPARELYGLSFHDPDFDPGKVKLANGKTVAEAAGESLGLDRYQAYHGASSPYPTKRHRVPDIQGACGVSSVLAIFNAIGLTLRQVVDTSKPDVYLVEAL